MIEVSFSVKRTLLPLGLSSTFELGRNVYGPIVKIASSLVSCWRSWARTRASSTVKWEGLGDIIVGARFEAEDGVGIGVMAREHDDWRLEAVLAQDAHGFVAVDVGQADIHNHQIDLSCLGGLHALDAVSAATASNSSYSESCSDSASRSSGSSSTMRIRRVLGINSDPHSHLAQGHFACRHKVDKR